MTHTPGPWGIRHNETWGVVLVADGGRHVAKVFNSGDLDQVDGDARLIAAAPEMLALLRRLVAVDANPRPACQDRGMT